MVHQVSEEGSASGLAPLSGSIAHRGPGDKPLVTVVLPALNEAAILQSNLSRLCAYLDSLADRYRWEIIVVNDGSTDETGALAEEFARTREDVRVFHHIVNFGLGQGFRTAFAQSTGDYVITLDIDLSYSEEHVERLLSTIQTTKAKVVVASPYMRGGRISNVPALRRILSMWANRFLSLSAQGDLSTLTSMVRAYDGRFIRNLDLRSMGMEVMQEVIYKTMLLRGRILEIPAHLDWGLQRGVGERRRSSMRIIKHSIEVVFAGFLFRPFMFFVLPGLALLILSLYVNGWVVFHFLHEYSRAGEYSGIAARASVAMAAAYTKSPHSFIVGGLSLMIAIQLISLGLVSFQSKRYFEDIFHLGTSVHKGVRERESPRP